MKKQLYLCRTCGHGATSDGMATHNTCNRCQARVEARARIAALPPKIPKKPIPKKPPRLKLSPELRGLRRRLSRHGLTVERYNAMVDEQEGLCAVCACDMAQTAKGPCIDHCHGSGRVRGLLCVRCNVALGMLQDNPDYAEAAAVYLKNALC